MGSPRKPSNYYEVLGVNKTATLAEIKKAFRNQAMLNHPDRNPNDKKAVAEERMKELHAAYAVLSDKEKRAFYDADPEGYRDVPRSSPSPKQPAESEYDYGSYNDYAEDKSFETFSNSFFRQAAEKRARAMQYAKAEQAKSRNPTPDTEDDVYVYLMKPIQNNADGKADFGDLQSEATLDLLLKVINYSHAAEEQQAFGMMGMMLSFACKTFARAIAYSVESPPQFCMNGAGVIVKIKHQPDDIQTASRDGNIVWSKKKPATVSDIVWAKPYGAIDPVLNPRFMERVYKSHYGADQKIVAGGKAVILYTSASLPVQDFKQKILDLIETCQGGVEQKVAPAIIKFNLEKLKKIVADKYQSGVSLVDYAIERLGQGETRNPMAYSMKDKIGAALKVLQVFCCKIIKSRWTLLSTSQIEN